MRIKTLSLLAALSLILSLTACPSKEAQDTSTSTETSTEAHTEATDTHTEEHTETPAEESEVVAVAGNPENGAKVFMSKTCNACHKITTLEGAVGALGPALDDVGTVAATRKEGMDAVAYLKESIEKPDAFLVEGFQNVMTPGLHEQMSAEEYQDLIAYLMSLKG